jgi:glycosyltransferase involved in cell wall biosynthesis
MRQLIVDLRCLQDPHHAERGIAGHTRSLLAHLPGPFIGLYDPALPPLPADIAARADALHPHGYVPVEGGIFLNPSPMTANQVYLARLLRSPKLIKAAVVYDFIPHDEPARYLANPTVRLDYRASLAWLRSYDVLLPISEATATRLRQLYGDVPAHVTGVALPDWVLGITPAPPRHVLMVGGDDERKNPAVLAAAHAANPALSEFPLIVTGRTTPAQRAALGHAILPGCVSTNEMRDLYAGALCVVVPSRAEGFSLPVIEAAAAGVPVLASDIPPHRALLPAAAHRFGVDDAPRLAAMLGDIATSPAARQAMIAEQASLKARFSGPAVAARLFGALPAPALLTRARQRLAMLTPLPPTRSGVADHSAATAAALRGHIDVELFPAEAGALDVHIHPRFDRVLSVIGNSHLHAHIDTLARRWGSAVLCHDARLMGLAGLRGLDHAAAQASAELGETVTEADIIDWSTDESQRRASFLAPLSRVARPLIFHSPQPAADCRRRFGADAYHLPFPLYRPFPATITTAMRADARTGLGFDPDKTYVVSLGFITGTKAIDTVLAAFALLREACDAHLIFAGHPEHDAKPAVAALGLTSHVTFTGYLCEDTYRAHLLAADAGLQLRRGGPGNISGALQDCIAAGLPSVASADLADNLDAPGYITRVADTLDPQEIASALLTRLTARLSTESARQAYARAHSMNRYAIDLIHLLGLEAMRK